VQGEDEPLHLADHRAHRTAVAAALHRWLGEVRRQRPPGQVLGALQPGRGQLVGEVDAGHLREVDRPGARDDVGPAVAAPAGGQPATPGGAVGEVVEQRRRAPVRGGGEPQVGERILVVGVAAQLGHQDLRPPGLHEGGHQLLEGVQPVVVAGVGRQGHVDAGPQRVALAHLVDEAGAGEQGGAGLVEGDGQDPGIAVEDRLGAVAVVHVDVDVGDAPDAVAQQPGDGDGDVVVDAEAARLGGHGVVQPAGGIEGVLRASREHRRGRGQRGSDDAGGRLVHAREDGVVAGSEPEAPPRPLLAVPRPAHRLDVGLGVDEEELVGRRVPRRRLDDAVAVDEAVVEDQLARQHHPLGPERVLEPVVVPGRVAPVPHQLHPRAHLARHCGAPPGQPGTRLRCSQGAPMARIYCPPRLVKES